MSPDKTRQLLREYGYRAKKSKGQNFLINDSVLKGIADAARIEPGERVVEIGPGPGNLTRLLARAAAKVTAVEIDEELAAILKAETRGHDNIEIINADALDMDFRELAKDGGKLSLVANLPYNITTPMLFKLLDDPTIFRSILLLIQKEVAERITAPPGKKPYGILAAQAQLVVRPEIALRVGPEAFSPRPKVDSALIRLTPRPEPLAPVGDPDTYRLVVKAAFAQRRKTIRNSFAGSGTLWPPGLVDEALAAAGIDPRRRAETVTVEEFALLANALAG